MAPIWMNLLRPSRKFCIRFNNDLHLDDTSPRGLLENGCARTQTPKTVGGMATAHSNRTRCALHRNLIDFATGMRPGARSQSLARLLAVKHRSTFVQSVVGLYTCG
jgi:hypothetical protein